METVSTKVYRSSQGKLRKIQAQYLLRRQKRISEAKIIDKALDELLRNGEPLMNEGKKFKFSDLSGMFSWKRGISDKEIDDVVYGDLR